MNIYCWEGYNQKNFLNDLPLKVNSNNFISDYMVANDIKKKVIKCDVININNAFIRDYLWKFNLIKELDYEKYSPSYSNYIKNFSYLSKWTKSHNKKKIIGVGQRFGNLNYVINSNFIEPRTAELEGYNLINNKHAKFGILLFEDFNIMQISLSCGINPFKTLDKKKLLKFKKNCQLWFDKATFISDNYFLLNKLLNKKKIDFYLTGGTFTCSVARKEGYKNIISIVPKNKINNLKQGIIFTEVTSILKNKVYSNYELFLDYILSIKKSYEIAMSKYTCNPVLQMGDSKVFNLFSRNDLDIIQWNTLNNSQSFSHEYQIIPNYKKLLTVFRKILSLYPQKFI